jgi:hypothetical protein
LEGGGGWCAGFIPYLIEIKKIVDMTLNFLLDLPFRRKFKSLKKKEILDELTKYPKKIRDCDVK